MVSKTRLSLQDLPLNLDTLTEIEDESVFKLERLSPRPKENVANLMVDLTFELNLDLRVVARTSYTILDVMSDVGGLDSILISGVSFFLSVWNFKHFDNHLVSRLYKLTGRGDNSYFKPAKIGNLSDYVINLLPKKAVCCRKSRREMALDKAHEALEKEIDIVSLIR